MIINDEMLKFKSAFTKRMRTTAIVIHHSGVTVLQSVQVIHDYYCNKTDPNGDTYIGIGYNYYIRKDGSVWLGRPEWARGGHAGQANDYAIGICCEGDYTQETMPAVQFNSLAELCKSIVARNGKLDIKKHSDVMPTSCPGKNFPFDTLKSLVLNPQPQVVNTPTIKVGSKVKMTGKKYVTGQNIPLWAKLRTYDVLEVKADRILVGIGKAVTGWIWKSEAKLV
jgi:N-acetyl-anhydromuramyl-L-alanine amidase AmpD